MIRERQLPSQASRGKRRCTIQVVDMNYKLTIAGVVKLPVKMPTERGSKTEELDGRTSPFERLPGALGTY